MKEHNQPSANTKRFHGERKRERIRDERRNDEYLFLFFILYFS